MKNYCLRIFIAFFFGLIAYDSSAAYCYTLGDGDWDDTSNWSCGYVPSSGDTIVISAGDTIYCETSKNDYYGVWLQVFGCLDFKNATRYVFQYGDTAIPHSMITFYNGSSCINGNGSSGLSFGSGGSGCDVYRPGTGGNAGVYPTIPASYWNGCVPASYLSAEVYWVNVELEGREVKFEWEIKEDPSILAYEINGQQGSEMVNLMRFDSRGTNEKEYYTISTALSNYTYLELRYIDPASETHIISTLDVNAYMNDKYQISVKPNPFNHEINVSGLAAFDLKLFSIDGRIIEQADGSSHYSFNTQDLQSGTYFLELSQEGRIIDHIKVVK